MIDMSLKDRDIAESKQMLKGKIPALLWVVLMTPIAMLFAIGKDGPFPQGSWLWPFQEWKWGINGDPYWQARYGSRVKSWWVRCLWVWRNSNMQDSLLGIDANNIVRLEYEGDPAVNNHPLHEGDLAIHAWDKDGRRYWAYYSVHINSDHPGRCQRSYIGWKLQEVLHNFQRTGSYVGTGDPIMPAVYSVNPLMGYTNE